MSAYAIFIRKAARRSVLANDGADGDHLPADRVSDHRPRRNKALVLEAMTSLFQRHDAPALDRLYSQDYIQHNPDIAQGRDALAGAGRRAAGGTATTSLAWALLATISSLSPVAFAAGLRSRRW